MKKLICMGSVFFLSVTPILAMEKLTCRSQVKVTNLERLIVHDTPLSPGTCVVCCESPREYTIQSDESSDAHRRIIVLRNHGRCCGKTTQHMRAIITKSSSPDSDIYIERHVETTACGRAIQFAAYATGIVVYTSAIAMCVKMASHI